MNLDKILNEALNKAMIGKNRVKQVNSNTIADFVNKHLKAINYTQCCKSDSELLCNKQKLSFTLDGTEHISRKVGKSDM